ncbi:hypothetical protein BUALT_Bualt05G0080300 [Buddleja alternifolia]|uniref:Uncharacterized protein n=1 Tax=Buddleja alternifolia TaxID=168488 RepID=A0AAV6XPD1_9LAMI|nr:hypothetical protein BUALT_Bualt05G0080300 [Buddleja alternifolia]
MEMASSPAKSISSGATTTTDATATPSSGSNASKSLRGLNKPKCIKCGNVARSRCPYQSCKNCCAKAQNPCHIHVLKGHSSFPDKPPSSSPLFDQQSTEVSHLGNSHRLRQLSNNFAQFTNLQTPIRSRKPLTRKDAQVINEWRFLKLKEFKDGNIKAESEAFDRYMQNVSLLEDVFLVNSAPDDEDQDEQSSGENTEKMIRPLKLKLISTSVRTDNLRKRVQYVVDNGLKKLGKFKLINSTGGLSDTEGLEGRTSKKIKCWQGERVIALSHLSDKLNKARNGEDLKACWETASQIFEWNTNIEQQSSSFPPKWVKPATIEQEALSRIDEQFSSLEEIQDL